MHLHGTNDPGASVRRGAPPRLGFLLAFSLVAWCGRAWVVNGAGSVITPHFDAAGYNTASYEDDTGSSARAAAVTAAAATSLSAASLVQSASGLLSSNFRPELEATIPSPLVDAHQVIKEEDRRCATLLYHVQTSNDGVQNSTSTVLIITPMILVGSTIIVLV